MGPRLLKPRSALTAVRLARTIHANITANRTPSPTRGLDDLIGLRPMEYPRIAWQATDDAACLPAATGEVDET
jgi:hypothetical protein